MLHYFNKTYEYSMGTWVLYDSWVEDAVEWGVTKFCWCSRSSLHRLFVFSFNVWRHCSLWDSPEGVCVCVLGLMQCLCSCSRCPRPVPALATCWTLRPKVKAARLGLGSQPSTWARQWRHLSRRSSLSHGRCTCAGKESMELGIEERERCFLCKVSESPWTQSSVECKGLILSDTDHLEHI